MLTAFNECIENNQDWFNQIINLKRQLFEEHIKRHKLGRDEKGCLQSTEKSAVVGTFHDQNGTF